MIQWMNKVLVLLLSIYAVEEIRASSEKALLRRRNLTAKKSTDGCGC